MPSIVIVSPSNATTLVAYASTSGGSINPILSKFWILSSPVNGRWLILIATVSPILIGSSLLTPLYFASPLWVGKNKMFDSRGTSLNCRSNHGFVKQCSARKHAKARKIRLWLLFSSSFVVWIWNFGSFKLCWISFSNVSIRPLIFGFSDWKVNFKKIDAKGDQKLKPDLGKLSSLAFFGPLFATRILVWLVTAFDPTIVTFWEVLKGILQEKKTFSLFGEVLIV